ncbi:hypothetical protein JI58_01515 [Marinosulfonomonas sp. PRT-SC04]|nr:hypothetical protein JI58_01515 [Marinosulfonomonas sp. PRT-SC04]
MSYAQLQASLRALQLDIFGAFHPRPADGAPSGGKTLLLLGPYEPGFWLRFAASSEYLDGAADPLDRWSKRIVTRWAAKQTATAIFPSDGPPYAPFFRWAQRSGRAWASPVGLLVHDVAGLLASYRAAVALPRHIKLPAPEAGPAPCTSCAKPCLSTCPVDAMADDYDVAKCKSHISTAAGSVSVCMETGCLVRNACPAGHEYGRLAEQSAFHMAAFNPDDPTPDPDTPR